MRNVAIAIVLLFSALPTADAQKVNRGWTEQSPSHSEYFSWLNNTNEGATETQTLVNLDFFEWLHSAYGLTLDIYAFDSGLFDLKNKTMPMDTHRFHQRFPHGLDAVYAKARRSGTRLGLWAGPDGFGDTKKSVEARKRMMVGLCRDYDWALFKFDAVCGELRKEREDDFIDMMRQCRGFCPDLILLNHRLGLERAQRQATTFLWEGRECYTDVNSQPATTTALHHRAGAFERGLPLRLSRLTEDHGVCLSSCLDFWDDELVLQAFNRALVLSPQIYGNPWLFRDDEFPKLARLFCLAARWAPLLTSGKELPRQYGAFAVSRGDNKSRVITLRNNSWLPKEVMVRLDKEIGLGNVRNISLYCYHPEEKLLGTFRYGDSVKVSVPPFRAMLLFANANKKYDVPLRFTKSSGTSSIKFVCKMDSTIIPTDASALYEATVFAADNNALEVRSLQRSGETRIPQVRAARDAFFSQPVFVNRGLWDKYLFDSNVSTFFSASRRKGDLHVKGGCFRLDLGEVLRVDSIVIRVRGDYELQPLLPDEGQFAYVSTELKKWRRLSFVSGHNMVVDVGDQPVRYLKLNPQPDAITEVEVYHDGVKLCPSAFRASNLFAESQPCTKAFAASFVIDRIPRQGKLCIALNGEHGVEGAYAALKVDGEYIGAADRSPSYPANPWENAVRKAASNYTYYFPLSPSLKGRRIEAFVLCNDNTHKNIKPEIWIAGN